MDSERNELWQEVDEWFAESLRTADGVLESVLQETERAGLPQISVSRNQGKLLQILVASIAARNILEIGTLGGYSSICMARALPAGGRLITLEINPKAAEVARANILGAGLDGVIDVRVGVALDTLDVLADENLPPFDLVFIDADKQNNPAYFRASLGLSRPGSLIIIDNIARRGRVIEAESEESDVRGVREAIALIAAEPRVTATAIQTVGEKGYDGFLVARVNS
jgi:predicted O-methyltransferase YrrM